MAVSPNSGVSFQKIYIGVPDLWNSHLQAVGQNLDVPEAPADDADIPGRKLR